LFGIISNQVQEVYNETRHQVTSPEITDRIREQFEKGIAEQLSIKVSWARVLHVVFSS
jgi:hypothetical protein